VRGGVMLLESRMAIRAATFLIPFSIVFIFSCGYYSTSNRTAGNIKKIAVPYLKNETAEPEIEIEIAQRIIDGLITDNTLKVVSEEEADAVLEGSVIDYQNVPFTFSMEMQAEQYRLVIDLRVSLFNKKENSYIWENKKISAHGDYYLETSSEQNYDKALEKVYGEIVDGILGATVQEW
jgi:hypothetical protein